MTCKIKALGLVLVAVFAMSAVIASAASATAGTLTTFPVGKTVIATGEQKAEHVFTLTDQSLKPVVKCKKAHFDGVGTVIAGATTVTVTPTYSECTAFGLAATIEHDECTYILHTGTPSGSGGWHVNTTLSCPAGKAITIKTATCTVDVPAQELPSTSEITNSGLVTPETGMDLLLHTNISGITYEVTKDGIGCPLDKVGHFTQGDYVGTTTVRALDSVPKTEVGITLH